MNRVALIATPDYTPGTIDASLSRLLAELGGLDSFIRPGQKVLIKPNLLSGKSPEKAVTTHPQLVHAVIEAVKRVGATPLVGDSPGIGSPLQVAKACGILEVCEQTGTTFVPFVEATTISLGAGSFQRLEIATPLLEADAIINLPKLKTHQMMGLTCAVKNLYGAVVGKRKISLHLQAGTSKALFARLLQELAQRLSPTLTIVDAVTTMEGNGPGSGDPRHIGALIGGTSCVAVDTLALELTGLPLERVFTQQMAQQMALPGSRFTDLELCGDDLQALRATNFRAAKQTDVNFGLPAPLRRPLRKALTARPEIVEKRCVRCGLCVNHCPPRAMQLHKQVEIDLATCIRCFCCQELCPYGAIQTRQGALLRLASILRK
ncbi:MAG: (4Fe-4S)-binding protein [Desulfuromonas sp.]|nr:MAG: (4Fe-4S)-binding protein [Desulfuromonas sp.]